MNYTILFPTGIMYKVIISHLYTLEVLFTISHAIYLKKVKPEVLLYKI